MTSFFFSSRRRHTRYWRDWSSDVCSSDLVAPHERLQHRQVFHRVEVRAPLDELRSEERRVGKECRFRGSASTANRKSLILRTIASGDPTAATTHCQQTATNPGSDSGPVVM